MILHLVQETYYRPFNCCTRGVFCLISCKLWSLVWNETCLPSVLNLWGDRAGGQTCGSFGGLRRLAVRFGWTRWQQDESLTMLGIHRERWKDCNKCGHDVSSFQAQRKACLLQAMAASGHSTVNSEFCNISQKFCEDHWTLKRRVQNDNKKNNNNKTRRRRRCRALPTNPLKL